jgi:Zn finger protein HypA/HybF involved in hydrogenase expression
MHEHTFIQAIIKPIKNKEKVKSVEIEVGELAGIESDHLKEHLIEETGWSVKIIEKKSKVKCSCGYEGQAKIKQRLHDMVIYSCPKCGKVPEVLEGKDIKIIKVVYK